MSNRIEKARAEVEKLAAVERTLSEKLAAAGVGLQAAKDDAAEATFRSALDETAPGPEPERVGHARADLEALGAAIDKARAARLEAIPKVWRAQAEDLRDQARALRSEADKRKPKTERLLKELEEYEGVEYGPVQPQVLRGTSVGGHVGGAPAIHYVVTAKTRMLEIDAAGLETQAGTLEARRPLPGGQTMAATVDELLAALSDDPMQLSPRADTVLAWATVAEAKERARRAGLTLTGHVGFADKDKPLLFDLYFNHGAIDEATSSVGVGA